MAETALPAPAARPRLALGLGVAAALFGLALAAGFLLRPPTPPPPVLGKLPAFALTDQSGKPFGLAELQGKVWVADFVFTRCPQVCPLLTGHMAEVQKRAAGLGPGFQLVSISVDPTYDTPEVLTRYMQKRHLDRSNWHFLTGPTDEAIQKVVTDGFKEMLDRDGSKGPQDFMSIVHGGHFVLVDGTGQIRGYYDANEPAALDALLRDARALADG